ncbi:MAG: Flp pilus assembly protein CpaB [Hyphomonadaceae bacterium]
MSARQLIILAVAFIAAIGALLVIRGMNSNSTPAPATAAVAGQQVLVAARDIPQGAALTGADLAWRVFPQESVGDQFVTEGARPQALTELQNAVTRRAFARGEPITQTSVVMPDGRGFMAAQLEPGMRAVAIQIDPASSAGGFIQPNDHVDVVLSTKVDVEVNHSTRQEVRSSVILSDVRVLALDDRVDTQSTGTAPERIQATTAVLEMSQADARRFAAAKKMGDISLALRGVETEGAPGRSAAQDSAALDQGGSGGTGVLIHAFGRVSEGSW